MEGLCLGTAQFGFDYGINNQAGQPTKQETFAMLDFAMEKGMAYIDTAAGYGESELLLGEYGIARYPVNVITKVALTEPYQSLPKIDKAFESTLIEAIRRMQLEELDGCLLHRETDLDNEDVLQSLQRCKEKGLVKHIGVSIYTPQYALRAASNKLIEYIQIPYNVFDQRLDEGGFFNLTQKNKITVFSRSSFLQGLLLMDIDGVSPGLQVAQKYLRRFDETARSCSFSREEAALLFCLTHPGIDRVVFGVDKLSQLKHNFKILERIREFKNYRNLFVKLFNDIDEYVISPQCWKIYR